MRKDPRFPEDAPMWSLVLLLILFWAVIFGGTYLVFEAVAG